MKQTIETVAQEIQEVLSRIGEEEALHFARQLNQAQRIFVTGEGRSGLMGKAFAMRLMHGNYPVYVVGETVTPSIQPEDLLIVITGSGSTGNLYNYATKAREIGAHIGLVITNPESKIGEISEFTLTIPAATKFRRPGEPSTIQPLGNQFDQSVHLALDAIIIYALKEKVEGDPNQMMRERHTNLE